MNVLRLLATALTFLTRLPLVARFSYSDPAALARSAWLWPIIGAGFGWVAAQVFLASCLLWNPMTAAVLAITCTALLSGGFHEDGLADSADGFYGGYSVARRLEIMKDSRIGTFGALALIFASLLKVAALTQINSAHILPALVTAHVWARASSLPLAYALPYARFDGANKPVAEGLHVLSVSAGLLIAVLAAIWAHAPLLPMALIALVAWPLLGWYCQRKIAGITGDALGAINQLTELSVLLIFATR
jgi:adenosylcobinamide-GDP ribazoletransferase